MFSVSRGIGARWGKPRQGPIWAKGATRKQRTPKFVGATKIIEGASGCFSGGSGPGAHGACVVGARFNARHVLLPQAVLGVVMRQLRRCPVDIRSNGRSQRPGGGGSRPAGRSVQPLCALVQLVHLVRAWCAPAAIDQPGDRGSPGPLRPGLRGSPPRLTPQTARK